MRDIDAYSITDPEVAKCPFPYYAAMRRDQPVHRDPGTGFYWISAHDAVIKAAIDAKSFSSQSEVILRKSFRPRAQMLWDAAGMRAINTFVSADPPEHDDQRNVGLSLFSQRTVDELTPQISALVNELIDAFAER